MKIPIRDLLSIKNLEEYKLKFNRLDPSFTAVFIMGKQLSEVSALNYEVTKENLETLRSKGCSAISIITNEKFREKLKDVNKSLIIKPSGAMSIEDLFTLAREYEIMNVKSMKKRWIMILEDICTSDIDPRLGTERLLIEYGTKITIKLINKIQKDIDKTLKVKYKDSEEGVLVFVPDVKNFKLKVDLFAIIASLNLEIYDAKDIKDTINLYKTKSPKLVILGNLSDNIKSKVVLLELEKFDPFIKKLNYDVSPASNRKFETERIRNNYYSLYTQILEVMNRKKEPLPGEIKTNIVKALDRLSENYSFKSYIETAYTIKQFGRMFNVVTLWNMLENIRKEKSQNSSTL